MFNRQFLYAVVIAGLGLTCCNTSQKKTKFSNTPMYDLQSPVIINLPDGIAEISGMAYYPKDTSVFAIKDEGGFLYKVYLNNSGIQKWEFDKKIRDFEDLVLHDSIFYVLISKGDIESLQFGAGDTIATAKFDFPVSGGKTQNEFETLYYDDSLKKMVLLCKDCESDGKKAVTAWEFDISTKQFAQAYVIDPKPIADKLGKKGIKLRPSAAAIHPITNELYIISSINHLLVISDRQGKFKELYELDPAIYKQPEGIAFTPAGDMIISNEANEVSLANILIFKNKKKGI